jgi:alkylation response protein AidB-like acyl-CoA dehydrogenase
MRMEIPELPETAPLYEQFAARAAAADESGEFVAANFKALKASALVAAGVPAELGGAGLELRALARLLQSMAQACPSTALAFAMHSHIVATTAWRWRHQQAPVAPLLERVARERVLLVSTGGGDWVDSSGEARRAEGGYKVTMRKPFSSGCPAGDLLVTSSVLREEGAPAQVIHFGVPMNAPGLRIEPTWSAMGMRGTGSHDVVLEDVFVPEAAVNVRRPQGEWHPLFDVLSAIALPLIYSVYVGVAEAARERALALARRRKADEHVLQALGEMENQLAAARLALADWIEAGMALRPGKADSARALTDRTLVARGVLGTVDAAMNAAGGAAFFRRNGLEQLYRDAQGARFHPLMEGPQRAFAARAALAA